MTAELDEAQQAVAVLLDRIDYVNGADARAVVERVKTAMAGLDAVARQPIPIEALAAALMDPLIGQLLVAHLQRAGVRLTIERET